VSDKVYSQDYFKMFCPSCNNKILVEGSEVGEEFNCPGCNLVIVTPSYSEYAAANTPKVDPIALVTEKASVAAVVQSPKKTKPQVKKSKPVNLRKVSPKRPAHKQKKSSARKHQKRFPIEYILIPGFVFIFIQAPAFLKKYGFLSPTEQVVQEVKKGKPKQKLKKKEVVEEKIHTNEIIYDEVVQVQGLRPLQIADKQKVENGAKLSSTQVKKLVSHLKKHCYECHGDKKHEEELNYQAMRTSADFFKNYINFKTTLKYLETSEMPPPEESKMTDDERLDFIDLVGRLLYTIESKSEGKTGPAKIRRLSSIAYDNTVKSITGLDLSLAKSHQIDNSDDISMVSLEKFISAAQEVAQYARFDLEQGFVFIEDLEESRKARDVQANFENKKREILQDYYFSDFSYSEALRRAMTAVNQFNASQDKTKEFLSKLSNRHKLHVDFLYKSVKYFNGSSLSLLSREGLKDWRLLKREKFDHRKASSAIKLFITHYEAVISEEVKPNSMRAKLIGQFRQKVEGLFQFTHQELQERISDESLQKYLRISSLQDILVNGQSSKYRSFFIEKFTPHVKRLLSSLYRRPARESEVSQFFMRMMKQLPIYGLDNTVRVMMTNTFSNLKFLFRFEQKRGVEAKVDGFELANRLSYFLWNSPPSEELLKLAESGELFQKETLVAHIQKMLEDERAASFAEEFANTWLGIGILKDMEMANELNLDMYEETVRFFDYVVRHEVKVTDLINGNYSFMNARLLSHYGIEDRSVFKFEKVEVADKTRGGLLGQAAILTLTSAEDRTNPILRGNFVLNTILGTPTPPPPANAGVLPEKEKIAGRSLKDVLAEHRKNVACHGCHAKIDPLGFPLENYDEKGRWRENEDSVGVLSNGKSIEGPAALKKYLMKNKDSILKNLAATVFSHALGRGLYYYDYYVVNQCLTNLKANEYRFSAIVATIVLSHQFQHKF
jgi:hypothetical protein